MLKEVCMVHVPDALKHENEGIEDFKLDKKHDEKKKKIKVETLAKNKKMQEAKLESDQNKKEPSGPS